MPIINFNKADSTPDKITKKVEDQLIVVRDSETRGSIYYDFESNQRIKITPELAIYTTSNVLANDETSINISTLKENNTSVNQSDILLNALVVDANGSFGYITKINTSTITIKKLFNNSNLFTWRVYS